MYRLFGELGAPLEVLRIKVMLEAGSLKAADNGTTAGSTECIHVSLPEIHCRSHLFPTKDQSPSSWRLEGIDAWIDDRWIFLVCVDKHICDLALRRDYYVVYRIYCARAVDIFI